MSNPIGSPKSLLETILQATNYANKIRNEVKLSDQITTADAIIFEQFIRDYLAQIFAAAILDAAETEAEERIDKLWKRIAA